MKLSIKKKVMAGTALALGIPGVICVLLYFQILFIEKKITQIVDVREPANAAAYEMEINAIGSGMAVLKYLETHDPKFRAWAEEDNGEFKDYLAFYYRTAGSPEEKALGNRVEALFREYAGLGRHIMDMGDVQEALFREAASTFETVKQVLKEGVKERIDATRPGGTEKLTAALSLEADVTNAWVWLGTYLRTANPVHKQYMDQSMEALEKDFARFRGLTADSGEWVSLLGDLLKKDVANINRIVRLEEALQEKIPQFIGFRLKMDDLLDDEIQELTFGELVRAKTETRRLIGNTGYALLLFFLFGLFTGPVAARQAIRSIHEPVDKLVAATDTISRGQLHKKVDVRSRDELGLLANAFNRMIDTLRHTTVSRDDSEKIISRLSDSLVVISRDGRIDRVNPATEEMLGYTGDELAGRSWRILFDGKAGEEKGRESAPWENASAQNLEESFRTKTGSEVPVLLSCSPLGETSPDTGGMILIARDISHIKAVEAEKEHLAKQQLHARKMEAVGTLAGGIAHDFNNILQSISGFSQLLLMKKRPDDPDCKKLEAIRDGCQRGSDLTGQLLIFGRQVETKAVRLNINHTVKGTVRMLERVIPKMIGIQLDLDRDIGLVMGDPAQLDRVLLNLMVNARDAMPGGGTLTVRTENIDRDGASGPAADAVPPGRYVLLTVADTGMGMEKQVLARIFDPFYTTKEPGKGTGLGLATSYGIIKEHKGHIRCDSEPGRGSCFKIYLPVADRPRGRPDHATIKMGGLPRGMETILLVDDEKTILAAGKEMLTEFGYKILTAESGEEAVKIAGADTPAHEIDLVLLDLNMPGMGGFNCLARLRGMDPALKIIIASGFSETGMHGEAVAAGAAGFIRKPYRFSDLLKTIRACLDTGPFLN